MYISSFPCNSSGASQPQLADLHWEPWSERVSAIIQRTTQAEPFNASLRPGGWNHGCSGSPLQGPQTSAPQINPNQAPTHPVPLKQPDLSQGPDSSAMGVFSPHLASFTPGCLRWTPVVTSYFQNFWFPATLTISPHSGTFYWLPVTPEPHSEAGTATREASHKAQRNLAPIAPPSSFLP